MHLIENCTYSVHSLQFLKAVFNLDSVDLELPDEHERKKCLGYGFN